MEELRAINRRSSGRIRRQSNRAELTQELSPRKEREKSQQERKFDSKELIGSGRDEEEVGSEVQRDDE